MSSASHSPVVEPKPIFDWFLWFAILAVVGFYVRAIYFTPIELLLVALGGCSGLDLDAILGKRSDFDSFTIESRADKIRDDHGNRLVNVQLTFDAQFPADASGAKAREFLPKAMAKSRDWLCTVARTVQIGTPVQFLEVDAS